MLELRVPLLIVFKFKVKYCIVYYTNHKVPVVYKHTLHTTV